MFLVERININEVLGFKEELNITKQVRLNVKEEWLLGLVGLLPNYFDFWHSEYNCLSSNTQKTAKFYFMLVGLE